MNIFIVDEAMNIWTHIKNTLDITQNRPKRIEYFECSELKSSREGRYYIIKQPEQFEYLKLSEKDYFIWSLLDGNSTVKDIVVKYFIQYGTFAFGRIISLLEQLQENYFLKEKPIRIFDQIKEQLAKRSFEYRLRHFRHTLFQKEIPISDIDAYLSTCYEKFCFLLFTRIARLLYIIVSVAGFIFFMPVVYSHAYQFFRTADSYSFGILTIIIVNTVSVGVHEAAHVFTVKFYGRKIPRGGFSWYYGVPGFFSETSDIWMEAKDKRIAVAWAGPYSDIILGSAGALLVALFPDCGLNNLFYKLIWVNYISAFLNLNPLLELDGYFILVDWLEIPLLRKKSFHFLQHDFIEKLLHKKSFSKEEKLFTVFGILTAMWTVCAIAFSFLFLTERFEKIIYDLRYSPDIIAKMLATAILLLFALPLILSLGAAVYFGGKKLFFVLIRLQVWNNLQYVFTALLCVSIIFATLPAMLPASIATTYYQAVYPVILLVAFYYGIRAIQSQAGSRFKGMRTFSGFLFLLLLSAVIRLPVFKIGEQQIQIVGMLETFAFGVLAIFMYQISAGFEFPLFTRIEKMLLLLTVPCTVLVLMLISVLRAEYTRSQYFSMAVGISALFIFLPSLFNYSQTKFLFSFSMIDAGVLAFTLSIVLQSFVLKVFAASFIGSGLFLYTLIHTRFYFTWHDVAEFRILREKGRLYYGILRFTENILHDFAEKYGSRTEKALEHKCNRHFDDKHIEVHIENKQALITQDEPLSITQVGVLLQHALNVMTEYMLKVTGKPYIKQLFLRAYDHLYWQERELAELYVFQDNRILRKYMPERLPISVDKQTLLTSLPLFYECQQEELECLINLFKIKRSDPGEIVIRQGERGDTFYIIVTGQALVLRRDIADIEHELVVLSSGDYFGQVALIEDQPRNATVQAMTEVELLVLHKDDFDRGVKEYFKLQQEIINNEEFFEFLAQIPLFLEFPKTQIDLVAHRMYVIPCHAGDFIIRQGEIGDAFYIIKQGKFAVEVQDQTGAPTVLSYLGPGEYFGEIALLLDIPRTASVKALTDGELFTLKKKDFNKILGNSLYTQKNLSMALSRRMYDIRAMQ